MISGLLLVLYFSGWKSDFWKILISDFWEFLIFRGRIKHIEVDCHFIRENVLSGVIKTSLVNSKDQFALVFTKSLCGPRISYICDKMDA